MKNEKIEFKKGDELSKYYNFDNIKIVEISNRHGSRNLNELEIDSFKNDLKTYYFQQHNAPTKPGRLDAMVTFKNNEKLWFYSNSEADIMFYYLDKNKNLMTFRTDKKVDFEKY